MKCYIVISTFLGINIRMGLDIVKFSTEALDERKTKAFITYISKLVNAAMDIFKHITSGWG